MPKFQAEYVRAFNSITPEQPYMKSLKTRDDTNTRCNDFVANFLRSKVWKINFPDTGMAYFSLQRRFASSSSAFDES